MATVIERAIGNLAAELAPDRFGKNPSSIVALFARAEFAAIVTSNRHAIARADVEWAFRWLRGRRVHDLKSFLILLEAWVSVAPPWETHGAIASMLLALPVDDPLAEYIRRDTHSAAAQTVSPHKQNHI